MRVLQVNESAHLNSVGNLIPLTDQRQTIAGGHVGGSNPPARLPAMVGPLYAGGLDRDADWSTAPVKGNFDEFHNQWLTHWHSYQIADLFNRRNITGLNY